MDDVHGAIIFRSHSSDVYVWTLVILIIPVPALHFMPPVLQIDVQSVDQLQIWEITGRLVLKVGANIIEHSSQLYRIKVELQSLGGCVF